MSASSRTLLQLALLVLVVQTGRAQSIPAKGEAETLEVATWNIEWFGSASEGPANDERQFSNAAAVIEQSAIDLWALQEVTDPDVFNQLLDTLGSGFGGHLATEPDYNGAQRVAFVYRTNTIRPRNVEHILDNYDYAFAGRPPLHLEADVTLADTTLTMNFITLHAKCCSGSSEHERREEASTRLKNHIDYHTSVRGEPTIVLGDFNDGLTEAITWNRSSPYTNFLGDTDSYLFTTLPLEEQDEYTICDNISCTRGSNLDHILITDELFRSYVETSAARLDDLLDAIDGYVYSTSDHLPVYARFDFTTGTATTSPSASHLHVQAPFPNPARGSATLRYTLDAPATVQIALFDPLGRLLQNITDEPQGPGIHHTRIETADLAAGLYLVRFQAGSEQRTFSLMHVH